MAKAILQHSARARSTADTDIDEQVKVPPPDHERDGHIHGHRDQDDAFGEPAVTDAGRHLAHRARRDRMRRPRLGGEKALDGEVFGRCGRFLGVAGVVGDGEGKQEAEKDGIEDEADKERPEDSVAVQWRSAGGSRQPGTDAGVTDSARALGVASKDAEMVAESE